MTYRITPRSQNFSEWYNDIINHAQLADDSPVRGCAVLRPNGYSLWEVVQRDLNKRFEETGHRNAYFSLLNPEGGFSDEKDPVEGLAPQRAVVTQGDGRKLDEALMVSPTLDTITNAMYSKWIRSYRDLPLLINQWTNVFRCEVRTAPFLSTTEFLWQEGHTCHEDDVDARKETLRMLDVYQTFVRDIFAIPVIPGEKTRSEKFPGALQEYVLEAMMQDKKALQAATSRYRGDRFAKFFNIQFQNRSGFLQYVHQTSWSISTRIIGALIMTHSDDQGLVLPPKAAPRPVVVVPILRKGKDKSQVLEVAKRITNDLRKDCNAFLDDREEYSAGDKLGEWEVQGIPIRLELDQQGIDGDRCILAKRIGEKKQVGLADLRSDVANALVSFQSELYERARVLLTTNTHLENSYDNFKTRVETEGGFFQMHWCGKDTCEAQIKEETRASIACVPFQQIKESSKCIRCGGPSGGRVIFARSY